MSEVVLCISQEDLEGMLEHLRAINKSRRREGDGLGAYLGTGMPNLPGRDLRSVLLEHALTELLFLRET